MGSLCKLTLVYPPSAAEAVVELLLRMRPPIAGFTTLSAEGHGFGFTNASISERVRGRVDRQMLIAILPRPGADAIIEMIRTSLPIAHMAYWIEPVLAGGRLVHDDTGETAEAEAAACGLQYVGIDSAQVSRSTAPK